MSETCPHWHCKCKHCGFEISVQGIETERTTLLQTLATERDAWGERETELINQSSSLMDAFEKMFHNELDAMILDRDRCANERDALKTQNSDISDSCMELVKERDALKAENVAWKEKADVCLSIHLPKLVKFEEIELDRDRWRGIAKDLVDTVRAFINITKDHTACSEEEAACESRLLETLSLYDEAVKP